MIKGFHHLAISVADMARSLAFYQQMFEMEQVCPPFPFSGEKHERVLALPGVAGRMAVLAKDGFFLELFEFDHPRPAAKDPNYPVADHGLTHFGVVVEDIEATYQRLVDAGVRFHSPVTQFPGGMKAAYGRDPDGNVFELLERS